MADNKVTTRFAVDGRDEVLAQLLRQQKETTNLQKRMVAMARSSKRTSATASSGFRAAAAQLGSMVTGFFSVQTALNLVKQGYREWRREIEETAQASSKFNQQLLRELALAGDLVQGPDIRRFLQSVAGATREQASAAFFGVTGAAPTLPVGRRKELTREVSRLSFLGKEELAATGQFAGVVSRAAKGKSAEDVVELALAGRAAAGEAASRLATPGAKRALGLFAEAGLSPERALGLVVQGSVEGIRPSSLATIAGKIGGEFDAEKVGDRFAQATPQERLGLLRKDKRLARRVLGQDAAAKFGLVSRDEVRTLQEQFVGAQTGAFGGLLGRTVSQAGKTDPQTLERQTAKAKLEKALRVEEIAERAITTARGSLDAELEERGEFFARRVDEPLVRFLQGTEELDPEARLRNEIRSFGEGRRRALIGAEAADRIVRSLERSLQELREIKEASQKTQRQQESREEGKATQKVEVTNQTPRQTRRQPAAAVFSREQ